MLRGKPREITSITIEHGFVKLLVSRGLQVSNYRIAVANPRFFREGIASDTARLADILRSTMEEMGGDYRRVVGALPGYQGTLGHIELPRTPGLDPKVVIPREARRTMNVSPEMAYLSWHRLQGDVDRARWLVLSAARRSVASISDTLNAAGLRLAALELRPFALARAVNQADAIIAWTAVDGVDVTIVRNWLPVAHQSAYWGGDPVDGSVLIDRLTTIIERSLAAYDEQNRQTPLPESTPLYVTGTPVGLESRVGPQVVANLQRIAGELRPPMAVPADFPTNDLIVNLGLALWGA